MALCCQATNHYLTQCSSTHLYPWITTFSWNMKNLNLKVYDNTILLIITHAILQLDFEMFRGGMGDFMFHSHTLLWLRLLGDTVLYERVNVTKHSRGLKQRKVENTQQTVGHLSIWLTNCGLGMPYDDTYRWVKTSSGNGFVPGSSKPLP